MLRIRKSVKYSLNGFNLKRTNTITLKLSIKMVDGQDTQLLESKSKRTILMRSQMTILCKLHTIKRSKLTKNLPEKRPRLL